MSSVVMRGGSSIVQQPKAQEQNSQSSAAAQLNGDGFLSNASKKITLLANQIWSNGSLVHAGSYLFCIARWSLMRTPQTQGERVYKLSGSAHLAKIFKVLAEALAPWLESAARSTSDLHPVVKEFLSKEGETYKKILESLLPTLYINLASAIQEEVKAGIAIGLPELAMYLAKISVEQLPELRSNLDKIEEIEDPQRREKKILKLFQPIIAAALPNGINEFPFLTLPWVSDNLWSNLQKVLKNQLYQLYLQLIQPFKSDKKERLLRVQGGESLVLLAQSFAQAMGEKLPSLFTKDPEGDYSCIIKALLKNFRDMIHGSEELKKWLVSWLVGQFDQLGRSQDPHIKQLWGLLGTYAEPFFIHIFYHLSEINLPGEKIQGNAPDALSTCSIKLFAHFSKFFNTHGKLIDQRMTHLNSKNRDPEKDEILLGKFKILSTDFLRLLSLHQPCEIPLPGFLQQLAFDLLNDFLPKFFLKQYQQFTRSHTSNEDIANEMQAQFFDQAYLKDPSLAKNVLSTLYRKGRLPAEAFHELFHRELWRESGTDKLVQAIEGLCAKVSSKGVDGFMHAFDVSSQAALQEEGNAFMKDANKFIKALIERILLSLLKNVCGSTEEKIEEREGEHPKRWLLFNMAYRIIHAVQEGLKEIDEPLQAILQDHAQPSHTYNQRMRQLFTKMALDLHNLFGREGIKHLRLDGLPDPENLKQLLWDNLADTLFADQLFTHYAEGANWLQQYKDSAKQLEHYYQTTHPLWACHVIAQYGADYIQDFISHSSQEAAELLFDLILSLFEETEERDKETKQLLLEQRPAIIDLLSINLRALGASEEPVFQEFWSGLSFYIETALAKVLALVSKSIHEIEQANPNLMVDMAIALLKETARHFKQLNQVTEAVGEERIQAVDPRTIMTGFGASLNDGVPLDPLEKPANKERSRIEGFFYPLALKLLDLADLSLDQFPIPALFQKELGEWLIRDTIPTALLKSFQEVLQQHFRDELMLNFVQKLYAELNRIELQKKSGLPEEKKRQVDPAQKQMNETCGTLVLELVKMIPDTMVQYVFMKEQVKKMSAESIGEAIMPFVSKWTFLQMIDALIYIGLPKFHPSDWEGKLGKESLMPLKAFVRPDGKFELKAAKKFRFTFPKPGEQRGAEAQMKNQEADATHRQLRNEFTTTISLQLRLKAVSFAKDLWTTTQRMLDDCIERQFQQNGVKIKAQLDLICRKIFIDLISSVVWYVALPIIQLIGVIIKKVYIDARSDDIIDTLHTDTLENLFYRSIDTVVETLRKLHLGGTAH